MTNLSRAWPLGLGEKRWWITALAALALLLVVLLFDRPSSLWVQSWPQSIRDGLAATTFLGESDWILYPSAILAVVTAPLARFSRWRLMRTMLWQLVSLYAFIFVGVGLPSLVGTIAKRLIGRGRPSRFDEAGLFGVHWNWTDWTYQSFPSGHAVTMFALAAVVGFLWPRWFYAAVAVAIVVSLSRVSLGVHYPSDVIAGALLGLIGAYAVRWLFARRSWLFRTAEPGSIVARELSSLRRYVLLKQRDIARARR